MCVCVCVFVCVCAYTKDFSYFINRTRIVLENSVVYCYYWRKYKYKPNSDLFVYYECIHFRLVYIHRAVCQDTLYLLVVKAMASRTYDNCLQIVNTNTLKMSASKL